MIATKTLLTYIFLSVNNIMMLVNDNDTTRPVVNIYSNAEILISNANHKSNIQVAQGDKFVFSIDDVTLGKIYFEVPSYRRFFRYTDKNMDNVELVIIKNGTISRPARGEINGFKIADGIWKVELAIQSDEETYHLSHRFYQENYLSDNH